MPQCSAIIFDIARCSLHDGPGIRTTVFLKGCSMDCLWCHNPESKSFDPQVSTNPHSGEITTIGQEMTLDEVMEIVSKDMDYYKESGGGLTLSGGEALMQADFVAAMAQAAKSKGIHVALETAGMVAWANFEKVLPYIDLYLYDYKDSDPERLKRTTNGDYALIEDNFQKLYTRGASIVRRCLLVPDINDHPDHLKAICANSLTYKSIHYTTEILLYHRLGASKAKSIGLDYPLSQARTLDNKKDIHRIKEMIDRYPHCQVFLKGELC